MKYSNVQKRYGSDRDLAAKFGVHRGTIWRWVAAGVLPRPISITPGCSRFDLDEVEAAEAQWRAARDGGAAA